MKRSRRFAVNLVYQLTAAAAVGAASIGVQVILARQLGPDVFGIYGIAASVAGIAFILQDGGFRTLIYREATHATPGLPDHAAILASAFGWNILASVALLSLAIAGFMSFGTVLGGAICIMILTNLGRALTLNLSSLMRARDLFSTEAGWQIIARVWVAALMLAAMVLTGDLLVILAAGAVGQFAVLSLPMPRQMLPRPRFAYDSTVLRVCATLVAIDLVTALYFRSDVLLMAAFGRGNDEIGIYAALTRMIEAYIFVVAPVATIFFRLARLGNSDHHSINGVLWLLIAMIAGPALVLLALTIYHHESMVVAIFGAKYQSGATYLPWLIAASCCAGPNALLGQVMLARNRDILFLASTMGALIVNLSFNVSLVPAYGALGAALATFATEFSLTLMLIASLYLSPRGARSK
ncbi:oligosaccharide flippase family protein [Rhodopseudomonas palustris]